MPALRSLFAVARGAPFRRFVANLALFVSILALAACASSPSRPASSARTGETTARDGIVVLVSIDGLPADAIGTGAMPTVDAIAAEGVHARWMNPSMPTLTFSNHYTLATGLRPDRHGIVHSYMTDPALGNFASKEASAMNPGWWGGEPIWSTLQNQGGIAATMFWPGSEVDIGGMRPRYYRRFDLNVTAAARTEQVLQWLDLPESERPQLLTLYFGQFDVAAHANGRESAQADAALADIDAAIADLLRGLSERGLAERTDLIVVSDHGMVDVRKENVIFLDDRLDTRHYRIGWFGQMIGITPHPGETATVERAFLGEHPHYRCWRKGELPAQWHYGTHPRIPPIVCVVDAGWRVQGRNNEHQQQAVKGEHGFAPDEPSMRAVFVGSGPSLCRSKTLPAFDNVDVYSLLARLLRVKPAKTDGRIDALLPALREENPGC